MKGCGGEGVVAQNKRLYPRYPRSDKIPALLSPWEKNCVKDNV